MDTFKAIGRFIEQKRKDAELSQEELADKLKVSKATISLYESGDRKPTLKRLNQIAKELNIPLQNFLAFDVPKAVDLDLALRAEGISNEDIERIKLFIKALSDAEKGK
jgi:transcriptional regulator with XRE-family HTH domain